MSAKRSNVFFKVGKFIKCSILDENSKYIKVQGFYFNLLEKISFVIPTKKVSLQFSKFLNKIKQS